MGPHNPYNHLVSPTREMIIDLNLAADKLSLIMLYHQGQQHQPAISPKTGKKVKMVDLKEGGQCVSPRGQPPPHHFNPRGPQHVHVHTNKVHYSRSDKAKERNLMDQRIGQQDLRLHGQYSHHRHRQATLISALAHHRPHAGNSHIQQQGISFKAPVGGIGRGARVYDDSQTPVGLKCHRKSATCGKEEAIKSGGIFLPGAEGLHRITPMAWAGDIVRQQKSDQNHYQTHSPFQFPRRTRKECSDDRKEII